MVLDRGEVVRLQRQRRHRFFALEGVEAALGEYLQDTGEIGVPRDLETLELTIDGDLQLQAAAIVEALARPRTRAGSGRLVLVSATTPTRAGEGKTTTSIGLGQAFTRLERSVCVALREPSLGPIFGVKGGGTGGGAGGGGEATESVPTRETQRSAQKLS